MIEGFVRVVVGLLGFEMFKKFMFVKELKGVRVFFNFCWFLRFKLFIR